MKKKRTFLLLFSVISIGLAGILFSFRKTITGNNDYFKSSTLAANSSCTVDGRSGSYNFSFNATERTSGVDYWQCHTTSGYWTTCPNSSGCKYYKINADSGYDQIKTYDIAGNESDIKYLYKKRSSQVSGTQNNESISKTVCPSDEPKIIDDYYAYEGEISSVIITSNGCIKFTGTGDEKKSRIYSNAGHALKKTCKAGTYSDKNGKCTAEDYRLQNDTCWCAMLADSNGKLSIAWNDSPGVCLRKRTYCTDKFRSSDNAATKYANITSDTKESYLGDVVVGNGSNNWGSSYDFSRPLNSEVYAQYDNITKIMKDSISSYPDYEKLIGTATRSTDTINKVANFATAGTPSGSGVTTATSINEVCKKIVNKSSNIGMKTTMPGGTVIYIVPIISSAPCNFIEREPTVENPIYKSNKYYTSEDKSNNKYFYYCDASKYDGIENNQCYKNTTEYGYNYIVDYYYEG